MLRSIIGRAIVLLQILLPHHAIARVVYRLTLCRVRWFKNALILGFVRLFRVNLDEAESSEPDDYLHFSAFFTRHLAATRSFAKNDQAVLSPVDGAIYQIAHAANGEKLHAKGCDFELQKFLGDDPELASYFRGGPYAVLYLAPKDYHRLHMPVTGKLLEMHYVPGRLFPVHGHATRSISGLFARNERVISLFETHIGRMAVVMVGAFMVGSMQTAWAGRVAPRIPHRAERSDYRDKNIILQQNEELGFFMMGSTVVLLFEPKRVIWNAQRNEQYAIKVSQNLGRCVP